jgi:hypothetical protein
VYAFGSQLSTLAILIVDESDGVIWRARFLRKWSMVFCENFSMKIEGSNSPFICMYYLLLCFAGKYVGTEKPRGVERSHSSHIWRHVLHHYSHSNSSIVHQ